MWDVVDEYTYIWRLPQSIKPEFDHLTRIMELLNVNLLM